MTIGTTQQEMIAPHGGELIDRLAPEEDREGYSGRRIAWPR